MKHILIMRATQEAIDAAKGVDFEEILNAMGAYNEQMLTAGVMVGGEGLADEPGYIVEFGGEAPVVSDGPYGSLNERFNGFWILQTETAEEAIDWAKRCPLGPGNKLEIRRVHEDSDFEEWSDNEYVKKGSDWKKSLDT